MTLVASAVLGAVGVLLIAAQNPYDELRDPASDRWNVEAALYFWGLFSLLSTPVGFALGGGLFAGRSVWKRRARPASGATEHEAESPCRSPGRITSQPSSRLPDTSEPSPSCEGPSGGTGRS